MQVKAWNNGGNTYGISVGKPNRDEFFKSHWKEIKVEIDSQFYSFVLTDGFWNNCPEFRSPIIRDWLDRHHVLSWKRGKRPEFRLIALGDNRFRLEL
jgi:hypothetical protein